MLQRNAIFFKFILLQINLKKHLIKEKQNETNVFIKQNSNFQNN